MSELCRVILCIQLLFSIIVSKLLQGGAEVGRMLSIHSNIHKMSFTGSVPSGAKVMGACAQVLLLLSFILKLYKKYLEFIFPNVSLIEILGTTFMNNTF